jgi:uncharacterized membrane protein
MSFFRQEWTEEGLDEKLGILLRTGVLISAVVVLGGGILYLIHAGFGRPNYRVFHGEPADLRSVPGILKDAFSLRPTGLIQLGLLLLIATPITRVAFSVLAFAQQRDPTYVIVTLIVFTLLIYSLVGGGL